MVEIKPLSVQKLVELVEGEIVFSDETISSVSEIGEPAKTVGLGFIISDAYLADVASTTASVLVVQRKFSELVLNKQKNNELKSVKTIIACSDAYLGMARVSRFVVEQQPEFDWPVDSVKPSQIDSTAFVSATASVGSGCRIGARTKILAGATVGPGSVVGDDCVLFPGCVVYPRSVIGNRVRLHSNVAVGGDGFGYARGPRGSEKIWHLGRVIIEDDVEIGPNAAIDRGTFKDTVISRGVKIDNLVQIGHNGNIGAHTVICAQTGLAGNVTVGQAAILAGKVGVADKITIGDGATIGALSGVSKDVAAKEIVMGAWIARPRRQWWKLIARVEKLSQFIDRLKRVEAKLGLSFEEPEEKTLVEGPQP
ncbi:MAG: UDP-3-O-(3-hydroxymyristoyl)glucosamine N-acyltransferase [Bacteriovoracia bacterium]